MPIEEFGKAMLRGMGWQEGMGVGRNRRQVDAIEYVRRPERLGLGAQPVTLQSEANKSLKMGEQLITRRQYGWGWAAQCLDAALGYAA